MMEAEAAANHTNLLEELNRRCEAFEEQAKCDAAERLALRRQLAAHEKLAQRRVEDEEAGRFEQRGTAVLLQQREEQLRSTREELRLERDLAFALREQVAAIEAVRATDARELRELQGRRSQVASPGGGASPGGPPHTPTATARAGDEVTWESILGERVQALEEARAGAQAEAATLRQQLEAARQRGETALAQGPAEQAREEAAAVHAQLQAQLEQAREVAEARRAEAAAASAAAETLRQRQGEQEYWLGRRTALLESAHREVGSLQLQLATANAATREAAGTSRGGGRAAAAAALEGIEAAAHEGHVAALTEEVAGLQVAQRTAAAAAAATLTEERASFLQADGLLQAMQAQLQAEQARRAETAEEARALQAARSALTVEVRARGLEVTRLAQEVGMLQARLGASNQEAISADEIASNLRLQQAHGARELVREGERSSTAEELLSQLRAALVAESSRVAMAWEQRERMRAVVAERDGTLRQLQTEAFHLTEDLGASREQVTQLQEQRRLGEILLEGAEERNRLRQAATQEARDESAEKALRLASVSSQLANLKETSLRTKEEALQRAGERVFGLQVANDGRQARIELLQAELEARSAEVVQLKVEIAAVREAERTLREGELAALRAEAEQAQGVARLAQMQRADLEEEAARHARRAERGALELQARAEQLRINHEAHELSKMEAALRGEQLRSTADTLETERARAQRENGVLRLLQQQQQGTAATAKGLLGELASERERVALLELRLAERDAHAAASLEELRAAELRGEGREARLSLLQRQIVTRASEVRMRDERLGLIHARLAITTEQLDAKAEEARAVLRELGEAREDARSERKAAEAMRQQAAFARAQVQARDEQRATMERRLLLARESVQVQLAMLEEEVQAANLKLGSKDLELELILEESTAREEQTQTFMGTVAGRLGKAHAVMGAKDALLAQLHKKLKASLDLLSVQTDKAGAAATAAEEAVAAREQLASEVETLQERHGLVSSDLATASEALDNYREGLASAEARAERDRQRMLELHGALRALQRQVEEQASAAGTATGATGAPANVYAALPPLAGAATGAEVAGSRVHYLYFLSSFLLLKTALSKEGRMANAPAQEVFEEIVANAIPLDEWPTYIFTRVFAAPDGAVEPQDKLERQMLAVKASAKHAMARQDHEGRAAALSGPTGAPSDAPLA